MRYGVSVGARLPGGGADPQDVTRLAHAAERLQFDCLWVGDHVVSPKVFDQRPHQRDVGGEWTIDASTNLFEPLTTLAFFAGITTRIKIGTAVLVVPYRNPVLAAKMLAMLDVLSAGRLIVGVGSGWMREEFSALDAPAFEDRGKITDEYIALYKKLWTEDAPSFEGEFYRVSEVGFMPKPVQRPHPPIWLGGNGTVAIKRVARYGQGWFPVFRTLPEMGAGVSQLRQVTEAARRDSDQITIAIGCRFRFIDWPESKEADRPMLTGSAEQMIEDVRGYEAAGVHEVHLLDADKYASAPALIEAWQRFREEVVPHV
jgi:probable F420-dependent oxidoreductase